MTLLFSRELGVGLKEGFLEVGGGFGRERYDVVSDVELLY